MTPLEDQQLAGIIMWIPAGTIYAGAALALLAIWIRQAGEPARQHNAPIRFRLRWLGVFAALVAIAVAAATAAGATWVSKQRPMRIARAISGGDPDRAPELIRRYGCGGCHTIPGIPGADGQVGPPLSDLIHRLYIGGVAVNSADQLAQWIVSPQQFSPHSAMPATGISEEEAGDIAAYLYSQ